MIAGPDPQSVAPGRILPVLAVWTTVSIIAAAGLIMVQPVIGLSPEILVLVMLAPAIGAAACWSFFRRRPFRPYGDPVPAGRFVRALAVAVITVVAYLVTVSIVLGRPPLLPAQVAGVPVVVMVMAQLAGALAEELGFRGILFPALAMRLPRWVAAVITGLLFGVWHVQYFGLPILEHAAFLIGAVALTVTMVLVMTGSFWQRMAVCTIIHLGANLALAFTAGPGPTMIALGLAAGIGLIVAGVITLVTRRFPRRTKGDT